MTKIKTLEGVEMIKKSEHRLFKVLMFITALLIVFDMTRIAIFSSMMAIITYIDVRYWSTKTYIMEAIEKGDEK